MDSQNMDSQSQDVEVVDLEKEIEMEEEREKANKKRKMQPIEVVDLEKEIEMEEANKKKKRFEEADTGDEEEEEDEDIEEKRQKLAEEERALEYIQKERNKTRATRLMKEEEIPLGETVFISIKNSTFNGFPYSRISFVRSGEEGNYEFTIKKRNVCKIQEKLKEMLRMFPDWDNFRKVKHIFKF